MSKLAIVYWSGTGNTESMAAMVAAGAKEAGAQVDLFTAAEFGPQQMDQYDAIAFGCPSMGAEQLEEGEFEPMFSACEAKLSGTIISIEKGQYSPSLMLSYRMAKVFGVTVEELCCLEENLKREDAQ